MQPSPRQQELERLYNARRSAKQQPSTASSKPTHHVPHISISDDSHHVTEAIGSYYDSTRISPDDVHSPTSPTGIANGDSSPRPYSFVSSPNEGYEAAAAVGPRKSKSKRNGSYFDMTGGSPPPRVPLGGREENEVAGGSPTAMEGGLSPKRMNSLGEENGGGDRSPKSPPHLSRQSSTDTAVSSFPLNDIDYESSPAAVAQELSNLQAIRRMSMNVETSDPDLPSFGGVVPAVAPKGSEDENDTSRLFWVPARLHPELAPKEFKTFIEDKVDRIRRRSGDADSLSPDGLDRSGSSASSLRRKKSMLSHQIDTRGDYEDGAERLERKRSKRMSVEGQAQVDLAELETLVSDPAALMRRLSLDTVRRSQDSGIEVPPTEDMPILPPVGQTLKRSTRTTYRRGSLKKGERVPFSKRAQQRQVESESDDTSVSLQQSAAGAEEPMMGLNRVQTEPMPAPSRNEAFPSRTESSLRWREQQQLGTSQSAEDIPSRATPQERPSQRPPVPPHEHDREARQSQEQQQRPSMDRPQQRQFHSRLASGPGRTTAQLPGYNNTNPLPNIIETLPDGTKVPVAGLTPVAPERKSSHELPRPFSRGGAHTRPVPGREQHQRSATLDDISSHPSPLPGSGATRTDALTMVPTFEDRKTEKKDGPRKSSWKWILGNDEDKEKDKVKEERTSMDSTRSSKSGKLSKAPSEKARLDVLQNSIDGNVPPRGRESLVLSREDIRLDEERKKESSKVSSSKKDKDSATNTKETKDSGLLSAIFGVTKKVKSSDSESKPSKHRHGKSDRASSPNSLLEASGYMRVLKPDIDYNWTRFSILEERAIYRMAHIKLANPRRALYSQVLLSNFMYSYLAKVQLMHPGVQQQGQQQGQGQQGQGQGQGQQKGRGQEGEQSVPEYREYQRWSQQQERDSTSSGTASNQQPPNGTSQRTSVDIATGAGAQQQLQYHDGRRSCDYNNPNSDEDGGYDARSSEEYDYDSQPHSQSQQSRYQQYQQQYHQQQPQGGGGYQQQGYQRPGSAGQQRNGGAGGGGRGGYAVSDSRDYLGYPKEQRGVGGGGSMNLWDDEDDDRDGEGRAEMW